MEENDTVLSGAPSSEGGQKLARLVILTTILCAVAVVAAVAVPNFRNAANRAKVRRTTGDIRSIATAWESFATDNNAYCPPGHRITRYRWDNIPGDTLRRWLEPVYIRKMPLTDAWGRTLQFAVECGQPETGFYSIRSAGPDGVWFDDPQFEDSDEIRDYDIVFANGGFFLGDRAYSKAAPKGAPARGQR